MLKPMPSMVLVEPIKRSEQHYQNKAGLLVSEPEFQGVPNTGKVYAIGSSVSITGLRVGLKIVFNDPKPKSIKHGGIKVFAIDAGAVEAFIND